MLNERNWPGPIDRLGPYMGHPDDPRTPDVPDPDTDALVEHAARWIQDSGDIHEGISDRMAAGLDDDEWRELVIAVMRTNDPAFRRIQVALATLERRAIEAHMAECQRSTEHDYA